MASRLAAARWPLPKSPVTLSLMGWALLAGVVLTGALCIVAGFSAERLWDGGRTSVLFGVKMGLLLALTACLGAARSRRWLACSALGIAIGIVSASALMVRG